MTPPPVRSWSDAQPPSRPLWTSEEGTTMHAQPGGRLAGHGQQLIHEEAGHARVR